MQAPTTTPIDLIRSLVPTASLIELDHDSENERVNNRQEILAHPITNAWCGAAYTKCDFAIACLLSAIAIAVRMPLILRGESTLHSDEAIVGLMAQDIATGERYPIYFYGQRYMGALEAYIIALIRFVTTDAMLSLRLGPACVFAVLVSAQFLMLKRWFGQYPASCAASVLIISSPMFAQWTIAARGGYVEIFLIGTLVWWLYGEWFVGQQQFSTFKKTAFGFLIGLGFWLNPMILGFVVPVVAHAIFAYSMSWRETPLGRRIASICTNRFLRGPVAGPLLVVLFVLAINFLSSVQVTSRGVQYQSGFGLIPASLVQSAFFICVGLAAIMLWRHPAACACWRRWLNGGAPFVFGMLLGNMPAIIYVASRGFFGQELDESVPLGIRPLWTIHESAAWGLRGLPVLFGSNPQAFLDVTFVAQNQNWREAAISLSTIAQIGNWTAISALIVILTILLHSKRTEIVATLRLQPQIYSPAIFLLFAGFSFLSAFLLSALVFDISSIRYLLPLMLVTAGVVAAATASSQQRIVSLLTIVLLFCWGIGHIVLIQRLGEPHPLRLVAELLERNGVTHATAEFQDAQLLSFLSEQRIKVAEYQPFWPRLKHYQHAEDTSSQTAYIVPISEAAWARCWRGPGAAPPETRRRLGHDLKLWMAAHPDANVERKLLGTDYEIWILPQSLSSNVR